MRIVIALVVLLVVSTLALGTVLQTFASARGGDPVARVEALTAAAIAVAGFVLLCRIVVKTTGRASEERSLPKPSEHP